MADIGYARVSTRASKSRKAQHAENQEERLRQAGCERVCVDRWTGKAKSRPEWDRCLAALRPGDTLKFTKIDRIGRSLAHLVDVMMVLSERGVNVVALDTGVINTTTAVGKMFFQLMAVLAEFEGNMISERTVEGLEAARERHGGTLPVRGPSITDDQIVMATEMLTRHPDWSADRVASGIGVSRATLYRHVDVAKLRAGHSAPSGHLAAPSVLTVEVDSYHP